MAGSGNYSMLHMPQEFQDLYAALRGFLLALGEDVREVAVQDYIAFKRIGERDTNFAQVLGQPSFPRLRVGVNVRPDSITLEEGFTCAGPHGASDQLRVCLRSLDDLRKAEPLLRRSYEAGAS